ncbi:MAG: hypothetical protein AB7R90_02910 [Reyranellaceae bacterium]
MTIADNAAMAIAGASSGGRGHAVNITSAAAAAAPSFQQVEVVQAR